MEVGLNVEAFTFNLDPVAFDEVTDPVGLAGIAPEPVALLFVDTTIVLIFAGWFWASLTGARRLLGSKAGIGWINMGAFFVAFPGFVELEATLVEDDVVAVGALVALVGGTAALFALLFGPL
jgi:hypothetical protein